MLSILLGKSRDEVKLTDFGMARSTEKKIKTLTKGFDRSLKIAMSKIFRLGTPLYMAPEIFKGGNYGFSADIYSLSITIWEILYRRCGILADILFRSEPHTILLLMNLIFLSGYAMENDHN